MVRELRRNARDAGERVCISGRTALRVRATWMSTRVLILTSIYPWEKNPHDAVFVRQQVRNLTDVGVVCEAAAFRYVPPGVPPSLWRVRYPSRLAARDEERGFRIHTVFVGRPFRRDGDV